MRLLPIWILLAAGYGCSGSCARGKEEPAPAASAMPLSVGPGSEDRKIRNGPVNEIPHLRKRLDAGHEVIPGEAGAHDAGAHERDH